jgi:hypothetical protein
MRGRRFIYMCLGNVLSIYMCNGTAAVGCADHRVGPARRRKPGSQAGTIHCEDFCEINPTVRFPESRSPYERMHRTDAASPNKCYVYVRADVCAVRCTSWPISELIKRLRKSKQASKREPTRDEPLDRRGPILPYYY